MKKVGIVILFILFVNLCTLFMISINVKRIVVDGIITETIKQTITKKDWKEPNEEINLFQEIDNLTEDERIRELLKSPEMQELINKYLDMTIENVTEDEPLDEVELEKDILEYLKDNRQELEEIVGQDITEEMIDKTQEQLEGKDLSKYFKQTIENTKRSMTEKEKTVLKGYKVLTSSFFHLLLGIGMVIVILGIGLIEWSIVDTISLTGKGILTSAGITILIGLIVKGVVSYYSSFTNFHLTSLFVTGLIGVFIGVGMILPCSLEKRKKEKECDTQNL